jgi:hypothetical protein
MAKLTKGFHLFGTKKVFIRSLVIYQCVFKPGADEGKLVSIQRTYKELDGSLRHEASNVDYTVFPRGGTFHLHDLFLTELFGISVTFLNGKGQFEFFDLKSNVERTPLLTFLAPGKEEILLSNHAEASSAE